MNFKIFHENSQDRNSHFQKNRENHIQKFWEFTLVIMFVISPQKYQLRLENESLEISRNSAYS